MDLANYLESVVLRKLRGMAAIPLDKKKVVKTEHEGELDDFDLVLGN